MAARAAHAFRQRRYLLQEQGRQPRLGAAGLGQVQFAFDILHEAHVRQLGDAVARRRAAKKSVATTHGEVVKQNTDMKKPSTRSHVGSPV